MKILYYEKNIKIKLKDICDLRLGYSFRSRIEPSTNGNIAVIQMKDLTGSGIVDTTELVRTDFSGMKANQFVQTGDLIFRSRGTENKSALLDEQLGQTVISAPMFRLRIRDRSQVLPEYLNWYIAQPRAQCYFASRVEGSNQKMINRTVLENLEVYLPPFEKQNHIVELNSLAKIEYELTQEIALKRNLLWNELLMRTAQGDENYDKN